jgi:hypothetical protein
VQIGLAEHHRARLIQHLDDRRVMLRDSIGQDPRAAGGANALGSEAVLVRDRDAA